MNSEILNFDSSFENNNDEQFSSDNDFAMVFDDIFPGSPKKDFSFSLIDSMFAQRDDSTKDITCKYSKSTFDNFKQILKKKFIRDIIQNLTESKKKKKEKKYVKKKIAYKKRPGRKKTNDNIIDNNNEINKNIHSNRAKDNLIRKLRIRVIKFSIALLNDCIKKELKRQTLKIRNISSEITSNIIINFNNYFFDLTLEQILTIYPISDEYKKVDKDENKKQIERLNKNIGLPISKELIKKTFKELFIMFREADINFLKERYGLNKAENLNMFISSLNESEDYINELREKALNFFDYFDPKLARNRSKK